MHDFFAGLKHRSISSILAGIVLAAVAGILFEAFVYGKLFEAVPLRYLLTSNHDDYTNVVKEVENIKFDANRLPIYFAGSSSMREALGSKAELNQKLRLKFPQIDAYKLTNSSQSALGAMAILNHLPNGPGIMVVGVNYLRFYHDLRDLTIEQGGFRLMRENPIAKKASQFSPAFLQPRLRSARLAEQMKEKYLNYVRLPKYRRGEFREYRYDEQPDLNENQKLYLEQRLDNPFHIKFYKYHKRNFFFFDELIKLAKSKNIQMVFVDMPMNPRVFNKNSKVNKIYQDEVHKRSRDHKIPYLQFSWSLGFEEKDFYDFSHVRPWARKKYQAAMLTALIKLIENAS